MQSVVGFRSTSDGWRGKLACNFTFKNVQLISKAIALYLIEDKKENRIVIGHDTRFMSVEFADYIATQMSNYGLEVLKINDYATTPLVSFSTNYYNAGIGINITASHNPPYDNGIKIRMDYGGAPTETIVDKIEAHLKDVAPSTSTNGSIKILNPISDYIHKLKSVVDFKAIESHEAKILIDSMHGTTNGLLAKILRGTRIKVDYINRNADPYFGGINPEPKFESTQKMQNRVKKLGYNLGIAHDGDGDRIVACFPNHGYQSPHDLSALLLLYLAKYKRLSGKVLCSTTLGRKTKRVCDFLNMECITMPVGFKNATKDLMAGTALVAAEENGGIGFSFYLPERDTTLAALLLLEADSKIGLQQLNKEVETIAGRSGFCRYNFTTTSRDRLFKTILSSANQFACSREIANIDYLDGVKIYYKNGDWLSIRYSGTEDILRIYCEADSRTNAIKIKNDALKKIGELEK